MSVHPSSMLNIHTYTGPTLNRWRDRVVFLDCPDDHVHYACETLVPVDRDEFIAWCLDRGITFEVITRGDGCSYYYVNCDTPDNEFEFKMRFV